MVLPSSAVLYVKAAPDRTRAIPCTLHGAGGQGPSAGPVVHRHVTSPAGALAVVIPVTPPDAAQAARRERGGRRGKERERGEEVEQTPTPGADPGLPPRGADREETGGRAGLFTCQQPHRRGSAPFRHDCCQHRLAADREPGIWPLDTTGGTVLRS